MTNKVFATNEIVKGSAFMVHFRYVSSPSLLYLPRMSLEPNKRNKGNKGNKGNKQKKTLYAIGMNLQIFLAIIYFNVGIYAWHPFRRNFQCRDLCMKEQKTNFVLFDVEIDDGGIDAQSSRNSTNHTLMEHDEIMKMSLFYIPV